MNQRGENMQDTAKLLQCTACNKEKVETEFSLHKGRLTGRHDACKECIRDKKRDRYLTDEAFRGNLLMAAKKWRDSNPGRVSPNSKWNKMKHRYGITREEFKSMEERQGGLCAIEGCGRTLHAVDHCHETGVVRGLLCTKCNSALGMVDEDVYRLQGMIRYILDA